MNFSCQLPVVRVPAACCVQEVWRGWVEPISWSPRILLYHDFLSPQECDHLISISKNNLTKTGVLDGKGESHYGSEERSSSGLWVPKHYDEVVARIERRVSMASMLPVGEPCLIYSMHVRAENQETYRSNSTKAQGSQVPWAAE